MIKRCDKGAGIIVLDFEEYMRACNVHLQSKLKTKNGSTQTYYTKVDQHAFQGAKNKLKKLLEEGLDHKYLTKDEFEAMNPEGKILPNFIAHLKFTKITSQWKPLQRDP